LQLLKPAGKSARSTQTISPRPSQNGRSPKYRSIRQFFSLLQW
jgi:hypothetical protein